jgi:hypothetical protein
MTACLISPLANHMVRPAVPVRMVVRTLHSAVVRPTRPPRPVLAVAASPPDPPAMEEVQRLLAGVLEALDGRRPAAQLEGVLPRRYQQQLLTSPGAGPRRLRSLHLSRTAADIIDVCGRVEQTDRSRALTGRLVHDQGKWTLAQLEFV